MAGVVWRSEAGTGLAGTVFMERAARSDQAVHDVAGVAWSELATDARRGLAGAAPLGRRGMAGDPWYGAKWRGIAGLDSCGQGGSALLASPGVAGSGSASRARQARQRRRGRIGGAGMARRHPESEGTAALAWHGLELYGSTRHCWQGWPGLEGSELLATRRALRNTRRGMDGRRVVERSGEDRNPPQARMARTCRDR